MTKIPTREERLYRLNGRLASIMRQLGSCIGESRVLCDNTDFTYKHLEEIYKNTKFVADLLHRRYLE